MMQPGIPPTAGGMAGRIRRLLLEPGAEWARIAAEPMTVKGIMTGWVAPLAAIRPVAELIGALVFGYGAMGIVYRPTLASALTTAVVDYALSLAAVWAMGLVIAMLAPTFGGRRDQVAAIKVAAFSATAMYLAGIFHIVPPLAVLSIVGLYSFYLLYVGLPILMGAAPDRAIGYVAASVAMAALLVVMISVVTSAVTVGLFAPM